MKCSECNSKDSKLTNLKRIVVVMREAIEFTMPALIFGKTEDRLRAQKELQEALTLSQEVE